MTTFAAFAPKLAVFLVATIIGGSLAFVGVSALRRSDPISAATEAPDFTAAAAPDTPNASGGPSAFDLTRTESAGSIVNGLPPADLALAAADLLDNHPVSPVNPSGFPRVKPITQFDGGPFQNANCTLAAGAMLARLGWGIVTTGSTLRMLQLDQAGGTGLDDLGQALWTGYGVAPRSGLLKPTQLKELLEKGYGAVIQGLYQNIPEALRLQKSFTGSHAIYVDAYWPGDGSTPPAYYVIDPIGRPQWGYEGDWWPASVVDEFATSFTTAMADGRKLASLDLNAPVGSGRIAAAWVFPPGGVPPEISDPDVLPIPPSPPGGGGPGPSPSSEASASPDASASVGPIEPGDSGPVKPELVPIDTTVTIADVDLVPWLLTCIIQPKPAGCPDGLPGVFKPLKDVVVSPPPAGPVIDIRFVDSDRPNTALVGFTVSQPLLADVRFWPELEAPVTAATASSIGVVDIGGEPILVARLDVEAATTYHFQVVAGDVATGAISPVGTFTTAAGLRLFDVALGEVAAPTWSLGTGFTPYLHLVPGGFAPPLPPAGGGCQLVAFGAKSFCLIPNPLDTPIPVECQTATVDYSLVGIDATGVHVRAFPTEKGVLGDGSVSYRAAIEALGPAGDGQVVIGCLTPGLTYNVVIDAIGDAGGPLGVHQISLP